MYEVSEQEPGMPTRSKRLGPIFNLFASRNRQIVNVQSWNDEFGWGFTNADFDALGTPPDWRPSCRTAVVLVPYLDYVAVAVADLWTIATRQHVKGCTAVDAATLRGFKSFGRRRLAWRVIDLAPGWDWSPDGWRTTDWESTQRQIDPHRNPAKCVGLEGLAAAAHFPRWASSLDGYHSPGVILSGLIFQGRDVSEGNIPVLTTFDCKAPDVAFYDIQPKGLELSTLGTGSFFNTIIEAQVA